MTAQANIAGVIKKDAIVRSIVSVGRPGALPITGFLVKLGWLPFEARKTALHQ
jgi:hypothetical protein